MYGYIYKTTNLINGKIYIGQKKSNYFLGYKYLGSGKYLKCAIQHYGRDNFQVELVAKAETQQQLDDLEKMYIQFYDSTNHNVGYNIANGAAGGDTYSNLSDIDKEKRHNKLLGRQTNLGYKRIHKGDEDKSVPLSDLDNFLNNGWQLGVSDRVRKIWSKSHKNTPRTDEWKRNISKSLLNKSETEKERLRKIRSAKTKQQMSNTPKEIRILIARNANKFKGQKCAWVNNGVEQHFIYETELQDYLDNGYCKGMLKRRK